MGAIGPFKICSWSDTGFFKKNPDDDPKIETRVGVHFTIKTTKKWFYVCISWCKQIDLVCLFRCDTHKLNQ
jgi:hypothetical protein